MGLVYLPTRLGTLIEKYIKYTAQSRCIMPCILTIIKVVLSVYKCAGTVNRPSPSSVCTHQMHTSTFLHFIFSAMCWRKLSESQTMERKLHRRPHYCWCWSSRRTRRFSWTKIVTTRNWPPCQNALWHPTSAIDWGAAAACAAWCFLLAGGFLLRVPRATWWKKLKPIHFFVRGNVGRTTSFLAR